MADSSNVIDIYRPPVAMPAEVKAAKGWLLWKLEQHQGEKKPRKVPYYIDGTKRHGVQGGPADRSRLATYERACLACSRGGYSGIGLAMLPDWGIVAADFDAVIGPDGTITPAVVALISLTYSEVSPSGTGVRAFFTGAVPGNRKDNSQASPYQVEFFTSKGFVTVTGNPTSVCELMGMETTLSGVTPALSALYTDRFGHDTAGTSPVKREDIDPRSVREMLDKINPDSGHAPWFSVGQGLHHQFGADGFDLWNEWSAKGTKYPGEKTLLTRWRSIKDDAVRPVTIGTIRSMARDGGWREDLGPCLPIPIDLTDQADVPLPSMVRDKNGRIEPVVDNVVKGLNCPAMARMTIGHDEFRDEIMLSTDGGKNWRPFKDTDYVTLRINLERTGFKPIGRDIIRDTVARVAEDNRFDSAILWINSLPAWDGVPRIDTFHSTYLGAEDCPFTRAVSAYLWTALAGRCLSPGCQVDMVPIWIGAQGIKKSSAAMAMAPAQDFACEINFAEKETDTSRRMRGRLIGEIGELRGLNSRDIEHIKSFVTRRYEDWTPKFKEFNTVFPRRIVFIGTTNQMEFLADETGNRRWLPIKVTRADVAGITRDRDQLWAEARDRFQASGVEWSEAEKLGRESHEDHMISDPWEDTIRSWLDQDGIDGIKNADRAFLRSSQVLKYALNFDDKHVSRKEELRLGKVFRALGYEKGVTRENGKLIKAWLLPVPF